MASERSDLDRAIYAMLERQGGGAQMRDALQHMDAATHGVSSVLVRRLLKLWALGSLSANTLQWLAEGALEDGIDVPDVARLATLGTSGAYSGNCRRDLISRCFKDLCVPNPQKLTAPISVSDIFK